MPGHSSRLLIHPAPHECPRRSGWMRRASTQMSGDALARTMEVLLLALLEFMRRAFGVVPAWSEFVALLVTATAGRLPRMAMPDLPSTQRSPEPHN